MRLIYHTQMTEWLELHPKNPQSRFLKQAADALRAGKIIVYPTDTSYAFACALGSKAAIETIRQFRGISDSHPFTLMCDSIKTASTYVFLDNANFRIVNKHTPGSFTFVLPATRELPKQLMQQKRHYIGIRISTSAVILSLIESLAMPFLSSSLTLEGQDSPSFDLALLREKKQMPLLKNIEVCLDSGTLDENNTTLVDLTDGTPVILKQGLGVLDY